jgi:surface antigen
MKTTTAALIALLSLALAPIASPAQPPPWAPAHGWRKQNDPNYVGYTGKRWEKDYGVIEGRCDSAAVGAVLGGVTGAVIGAKIGQEIDNSDRACMGHALELAGERKTVVWTNSATGVNYRLTPTRNFKRGKEACREFTTVMSTGRKQDSVKDVACRSGSGDWKFRT